ncbi:MAG TPA: hypothetical protein VFI70_12840, partial [Nitrososphaeraceae archaeon]|nr:hypothetical protein [Nitrososphaeraceae archaeon]
SGYSHSFLISSSVGALSSVYLLPFGSPLVILSQFMAISAIAQNSLILYVVAYSSSCYLLAVEALFLKLYKLEKAVKGPNTIGFPIPSECSGFVL